MLTAAQQVDMCRSLVQLKPSDLMWVAAALQQYNGTAGRNGYLTFEEMSEALAALAAIRADQQQQQQGGSMGGGGSWASRMMPIDAR